MRLTMRLFSLQILLQKQNIFYEFRKSPSRSVTLAPTAKAQHPNCKSITFFLTAKANICCSLITAKPSGAKS